jgi:hypothetical protein
MEKMMSDFKRCTICGDWDFMSHHTCKPLWYAIRPDYNDEDDPQNVYANDAEQAAETFVSDNFSNWEYPMDVEVWVKSCCDDEWRKFDVGVETMPQFSATEKVDK